MAVNRDAPEGAGHPWRGKLVAASAYLLLALGLRVWGSRYGLPWITEPDTENVRLARHLARGALDWDALLVPSRYPHLFLYLLLPPLWLFPDASPFWLGRLVSAAVSALAAPCAFLAARRLASPRAAHLAALLAAFSFLAVQNAHLAKPHAPLAGLAMASLWLGMRVQESGRRRDLVLAATAGALAVAMIQSGVLVIGALTIAVLLAPVGGSRRPAAVRAGRLAVLGAILAVGVVAGYPNTLRGLWQMAPGDAGKEALLGMHTSTAAESLGLAGLRGPWVATIEFEPLLIPLGLVALLVFVLRGGRTGRLLLPALAMVALFLLLFGHLRAFAPRFLLPLLPVLGVAAAVLADRGAERLGKVARSAGRVLFAAGALLLLAPHAAATLWLEALYVREDTREIAARWIRSHVPSDAGMVATPFLDFPLPMTEASILRHEAATDALTDWHKAELRRLREGGDDPERGRRYQVWFPFEKRWLAGPAERRVYVAKVEAQYGLHVLGSPAEARDPAFRAFEPLGEVVFSVGPSAAGGIVAQDLYLVQFPFLRIWFLQRAGPTVEVVRFAAE